METEVNAPAEKKALRPVVLFSAVDLQTFVDCADATEYGSSTAVNLVHRIAHLARHGDVNATLPVVIEVSGGLVQWVYSAPGAPIAVDIVDHDLEKGLDPDDAGEREEYEQRAEAREQLRAGHAKGELVAIW